VLVETLGQCTFLEDSKLSANGKKKEVKNTLVKASEVTWCLLTKLKPFAFSFFPWLAILP